MHSASSCSQPRVAAALFEDPDYDATVLGSTKKKSRLEEEYDVTLSKRGSRTIHCKFLELHPVRVNITYSTTEGAVRAVHDVSPFQAFAAVVRPQGRAGFLVLQHCLSSLKHCLSSLKHCLSSLKHCLFLAVCRLG